MLSKAPSLAFGAKSEFSPGQDLVNWPESTDCCSWKPLARRETRWPELYLGVLGAGSPRRVFLVRAV